MLKKFLSIAIASALILTSSFTIALAEKEKDKGYENSRDEKRPQVEKVREQKKKELEERLEKNHKDKHQKRDLMKEIIELRKQNNDHSLPMFINGKELKSDVPPVLKGGRILIPIRAVTSSLGADVKWDASTSTATVTKSVYSATYGTQNIEIKIVLKADVVITVNGEVKKLDVNPEVVQGRIVVPIRFIAETFMKKVEWVSDLETATIDDEDDDKIPTPSQTPTPTPNVTPTPV